MVSLTKWYILPWYLTSSSRNLTKTEWLLLKHDLYPGFTWMQLFHDLLMHVLLCICMCNYVGCALCMYICSRTHILLGINHIHFRLKQNQGGGGVLFGVFLRELVGCFWFLQEMAAYCIPSWLEYPGMKYLIQNKPHKTLFQLMFSYYKK